MEKGHFIIQTEVNTREIGTKISKRVMDYLLLKMALNMKDHFSRTEW